MTEQTTTLHPAAVAAANWWAEQIGAPTFRALSGNESRQEAEPMEMASMMQTLIASKHPVTEAQGARFAEALAAAITERLARSPQYGVSIGVDYGPDVTLADAATAAGVSLSRFPWKTHMRAQAEYVTAALGYGAAHRLVWADPTWERPECDQHRVNRDGDKWATNDRCVKPRYHDEPCGDWVVDTAVCPGCGLDYAGHFNRDADTRAAQGYHEFGESE